MAAEGTPPRGHAVRPHTADVRIEAWGADAGACCEEAVAALVATFADVTAAPPGVPAPFDVGPAADAELLVLLLEQVLFELDAHGLVPRAARVERRPGGHLAGSLSMVPAGTVAPVGAVPKGVSREGLAFGPAGGRWRCAATVDV